MMGKSKLEVVLTLRQLEEEISKARLAQSLESLHKSQEAVEGTKAGMESFLEHWKEAVEAFDSVEQLKLFPAGRQHLKSKLERESRIVQGRAREVEEHRQDFAARQRTRKLLESLVARRVRRKALLQEVREQNERDAQVLLEYQSS